MKIPSLKLLVSFIFLSHSLFAQMGAWTWMKGSNTGAPPGTFGVKGTPALANTPAGLYEPGEWTDNQGNFWLMGGYNAFGFHDALWRYNPATNMWTWMSGTTGTGSNGVYGTQGTPSAANYPCARCVPATWVDNQGNLWLFGGFGYGSSGVYGALSDLWKYDIITNQWTWMKGPSITNISGVYGTQGIPAPANVPGPRGETSASWTDNNGDLWMFGGQFSADGYNDLWKYNIATNQWTWMKGANTLNSPGSYGTIGVPAPSNEPIARGVFAKWKDAAGNLWCFGGLGAQPTYYRYNDLWKFDITTNNWTWMKGPNVPNDPGSQGTLCTASPANNPSSRYESRTSWTDTCGNFWLFGGATASGSTMCRNDLWYYSVATGEWTWVSGGTLSNVAGTFGTIGVPNVNNIPGTKNGAIPFYTGNAELWLWGGFDDISQSYNDLWRYTIDTNCVQWCLPVSSSPNAGFTATNLTGCAPLTVTFVNTSTGATSWSWNFGDGNTSTQQNPVHSYTAAGVYSVTQIAYNLPNSDTLVQTNYVTVFQSATATFTASVNPVCLGQSISFANGSVNASSYSWNFGDGNISVNTDPVHTYTTAGTHSVTLIAINSNGCNDTLVLPVLVAANSVSSQSLAICNGDSVLLPGGNYATVPGTYVDSLNSVNGCDSIITTTITTGSSVTSSQNPVICTGNNFVLPGGQSVSVAGTYVDTIPSSGGCDSIITTNLTVNPNSVGSQSPIICSGSSFILPGGATASVSGTYTDTLIAKNGCDSIITTNLLVSPSPNASVSADVTITIGSTTTLSASGGGSYMWSPSEALSNTTGSSVIATPVQSTVYCVTVTNSDGCSDTACVNVFVEITCGELYLPNAFSPNEDGENDIYKAYVHPLCVKEYSLIIYNRWGERIFETEDVTQGWDGRLRGIMSNTAVYVFYCKAIFTNGNEVVKEGNVSLVR